MKTPSFWYKPIGAEAAMLLPFSLLYGMGRMAHRAVIHPYRASIPVICVGNVVAGGAGKTPTALAIARLLQQAGHKPVFVTRGYGGSEQGPLSVDPDRHSARDVGDEALLLAAVAPTIIGRDRVAAIRMAERLGTHIVMDDGLQNPNIEPHISFLVIDGESGLGNNCLMPAGPLRETLGQVMERVSAVILIGRNDAQNIGARIKKPLLRAQVQSGLASGLSREGKYFAFAGIARPEKFYETCHVAGLIIAGAQAFADHHYFTDNELNQLKQKAEKLGAKLLTTEKDYVRLPRTFRAHVVAVPVKLQFEDEEKIKKLLSDQ